MLVLGMPAGRFGMLFKVAAVPFHVWTPDVYEGAPTPVTAFMSVGPKAAAFAMFLRVFAARSGGRRRSGAGWSVASRRSRMICGNVAALDAGQRQAHAGLLVDRPRRLRAAWAWSPAAPTACRAVLLYMLVYTFMNLGAFGFVILLESKGYAGETVADYAGLARASTRPAAFGMLLFLLSLAGIPPTAGFMGKLYLFAAAVQAGYVGLVVIAVLMSAVSLYYYFRIVVQMYLRDGEGAEPAPLVAAPWIEAVIGVCARGRSWSIGVWPAPGSFAAAGPGRAGSIDCLAVR